MCGVRASGKSKHLGTAELDTNGTERIDDGVWQSYVQQLITSCAGRGGSRRTVLLGELAADKKRRKKAGERAVRVRARTRRGAGGQLERRTYYCQQVSVQRGGTQFLGCVVLNLQ